MKTTCVLVSTLNRGFQRILRCAERTLWYGVLLSAIARNASADPPGVTTVQERGSPVIYLGFRGPTMFFGVSSDGSIRVWEARTGALRGTVAGAGPLQAAALSADGTLMATVGADAVVLRDTQAWQVQRTIAAKELEAVAFSPDGKTLAGASRDQIRAWEIESGCLLYVVKMPAFKAVETRIRRRTRQPGTKPPSAQPQSLPPIRLPGPEKNTDGNNPPIDPRFLRNSLAFQPVRDSLIYQPSNELARCDGTNVVRWLCPRPGLQPRIAPQARSEEKGLPETESPVRLTPSGFSFDSSPLSLAFSPDASFLVVGDRHGVINGWEAHRGWALRSALLRHVGQVRVVAFSPNGKLLLSAGQDGTVRLWDHVETVALRDLSAHSAPVAALAVSSDSKLAASGDEQGVVRVWELARLVGPGWTRPMSETEKAVVHFEQLGGRLVSDKSRPEKPIVSLWAVVNAHRPLEEDLHWLAALPDLKEVHLKVAPDPIDDEELDALKHTKGLSKLEVLHLLGGSLVDGWYARLDGMRQLRELRTDSVEMTDKGLQHVGTLKNLRRLSLNGHKFTDQGLRHLRDLKDLEMLSIEGTTGVGDAGLAHLAALTNLEHLSLSDTQITDAGLVHLRGMRKLKFLDLRRGRIEGPGLKNLEETANLESLFLDSTPLTDAGLSHLQGLRAMKSLSLAETRVTSAGVAYLKDMTKLQHLNLDETRVSDTGLAHLRKMTALESLRLGNTSVTDAGLENLTTMKNLSLTSLVLNGTQVTQAGAKQLKRRLPSVTVYGQFPTE